MKALVVCRLPPRVSFFFQARGIPAGGHAAQVSRARDYPLKRHLALGCVCVCVSVCMYLYACACVCIYVCMHTCVCACLCLCLCVCVCMYVCMYM